MSIQHHRDDLDRVLASSQLLDCHGRTTHTFTLLPDGHVRLQTEHLTALIDPNTRVVSPRGVHLAADVIDHACSFARDATS